MTTSNDQSTPLSHAAVLRAYDELRSALSAANERADKLAEELAELKRDSERCAEIHAEDTLQLAEAEKEAQEYFNQRIETQTQYVQAADALEAAESLNRELTDALGAYGAHLGNGDTLPDGTELQDDCWGEPCICGLTAIPAKEPSDE